MSNNDINGQESSGRNEFLEELRRLGAELDRTPRSMDLKDHSEYSLGQYTYRFETWNKALRKAGFSVNQTTRDTEENLIAELHRLADELGRAPYHSEMTDLGKYGYRTYYRRFGSWDEALEAAGLETFDRSGISDKDLLDAVEDLHGELGRVPTQRDMEDYGAYSVPLYQDRFGTWNKALVKAGYDPNHTVYIPPEDLLKELNHLAGELGRTPTHDEMDDLGVYSSQPYDRTFGGWNNALREAGLEPTTRRDIPQGELLEELHRLHDELGHVPRSNDMWERGNFSIDPYRRQFGSWNAAIEEAGYETYEHPTGSDHQSWNGGYTGDYGPNWDGQREKRLEIDNYRCIVCGMTRSDHYDTFGRDLTVHHVKRKEAFRRPDGSLDYERANAVNNLRTLCDAHHSVWEGVPVGPVRHSD